MKKRKKKINIKKLLSSLIVVVTLFMSVGYAAVNSITLDLDGSVAVKTPEEVFIYDVQIAGSDEAEATINLYDGTILNSQVKLSTNEENTDTYITYNIMIYNNTQDTYVFDGVDYILGEKTYDNQNIVFNLNGIEEGDKLLSKQRITISITFNYKDNKVNSNNILNSILNFSFKKIFDISYVNISSKNLPSYAIYNEDLTINFENYIPLSLEIYVNNEITSNYTYSNNVLTIPSVTGDVKIVGYILTPNLTDNKLVPIYHNGKNWKVADTTTEWYNYANQEWANAVILKSDVTKSTGDTIDVSSEVTAMFVWIPRYEYKISTDDSKEIYINFISKEKVSADNGYIIHPAFTFGTQNLDGIWVGKFETSTDTTSTCYQTSLQADCNNTSLNLLVVPNVKSLREQTISTQFTLSRNFSTSASLSYLDSHMMKNTEWAAVAYLSQSQYGKFGNENYSGVNKEIYVNNSSELYTGRSSGSPSYISSSEKTYSYDYGADSSVITGEENGVGASTTGNITGIYDMNGGTYEYVMGYLSTASSTFGATSVYDYAEFDSTPESQYYDDYTSTSYSSACNGSACIGHGFEETAGWYNDTASFLTTENPWVIRGGVLDAGSGSGIFFYSGTLGYSGAYATFRLSLSPTD